MAVTQRAPEASCVTHSGDSANADLTSSVALVHSARRAIMASPTVDVSSLTPARFTLSASSSLT